MQIVSKKEMYCVEFFHAYGTGLILTGMSVLQDLTQHVELFYLWRRDGTKTVHISGKIPESLANPGDHYIMMNEAFQHLFPPVGELWEMRLNIINKTPRYPSEIGRSALNSVLNLPLPIIHSDFWAPESKVRQAEQQPLTAFFRAEEQAMNDSAKKLAERVEKQTLGIDVKENAMTDREVLSHLVNLGEKLREMSVISREYPAAVSEFDGALVSAGAYLNRVPAPGPIFSVLQIWVMKLPLMQQSVLISAMRGPDGVEKMHKSKMLCRWLRRCIVISAFNRCALYDPYSTGGGSYTGPSVTPAPGIENWQWEPSMDAVVKEYLDSIDSLPHHFHLHFLHAVEILGYKHSNQRIREWWNRTYRRMAHDMHLAIEDEKILDARLNDNEEAWRTRRII